MEINGTSLIQAIAKILNENFQVEVYGEQEVQNISRPCFFIRQLPVSQAKRMFNRYLRTYRIILTWIPLQESPFPLAECHNTAEILYQLFSIFQLDENNWIRPSQMQSEVGGGELRFTMDLDLNVIQMQDPNPDMKDLDLESAIKMKGEQ